jgi:hypothetical protein
MTSQQAQVFISKQWPQIHALAVKGYQERGRGFVAIDLMDVPQVQGAQFYCEYVLEPTDEGMKRTVAEYDPQTQAVLLLQTEDGIDFALFSSENNDDTPNATVR